jgi:methylenetetrahydrofolate dehydrogenase (NADP+)/methenyltetrahydrofolate cyclohydrolase
VSATIIDGKGFAAALRARVATEVATLAALHGVTPGLAVVLVGDDPASAVYVRNKGVQTREAGMRSEEHRLPTDATEAAILAVVDRLNRDRQVHGVLVQLPLPAEVDAARILDSVVPEKDVDGFHVLNVGALASGRKGMVPCTPLGCLMLLRDRVGALSGLEAVVVGRSNVVGRPMAQLLLGENCTVTVAHSRTRDLPEVCRRADILVAAAGRPRLIGGGWVKPGATVIDVGITRLEAPDGKAVLVGDVDFAAAAEVASAITPVPGGVGPMTVACLLANTLTACCRIHGLPEPVGLTP